MLANFEALPQNAANYVPLTPLSFLKRSANVYADRTALIAGSRSFSWPDIYTRSRSLASALVRHGIGKGDTVSIISPNNHALFEAHFAIPMSGAVINTINTRLEAETIAYILNDSDAKVLIADSSVISSVENALDPIKNHPLLIKIASANQNPGEDERFLDYESFLDSGDPQFDWDFPTDEWQALALNYTSGTSGRPKGVVYHHRGSYIMALGTVAAWHLPPHPVYLYTVPMFHCNGWGHAWTMALAGGTVVCPESINAAEIFRCIDKYKITHFGGAPVVLSMLINAPEHEKRRVEHTVKVMTAGAPPPAAVLEQTRKLGFEVMQVYGLTETFGHVAHCLWQDSWNGLGFEQQAEMQSYQGVTMPITEDTTVVDVDSGDPVPMDGKTPGEIMIRGNTVMKGYYKNPEATEEAFSNGYFKTGDIAVRMENGYIRVMDRLKDVIISGGENISSVEVENVLHKHPAIALAAVVAMPDPKWGEVPCAFVSLKPDANAQETEVLEFCRARLAGFKTPKKVIFGPLPQTATGKIQKFVLRKRIKDTTAPV